MTTDCLAQRGPQVRGNIAYCTALGLEPGGTT